MRGPAVAPREPGTPALPYGPDSGSTSSRCPSLDDSVDKRWSQDRLGLVDLRRRGRAPDPRRLGERPGAARPPWCAASGQPRRARLVLFRRPIEHRAEDREELAAIVLTVLVDQLSELTGVPPGDLHPDYPDD